MKFVKISALVVVALFLGSCGPVLPYAESTETPTPVESATPVDNPVAWPDVHEQWTTYQQIPYIRSTTYDSRGYLWITSNVGVHRLDFATRELTLFTAEDGLPQNAQSVTIFDGIVWVGTSDGQAAYYNGEKWVGTSVPVTSPCYQTSLIGAQGKLWLLGCDGIYYYDGGQWNQFDQIPEEYKDQRWSSFYSVAASKDGSLWFQSYSKVLQFDGATWMDHKNLQGFGRMLALADGTLLFTSETMILSFDGITLSPLVFPDNTFRYPINRYLATPEGDLWVQIQDYYNSQDGYPSFLIHDGEIEELPVTLFKDPPEPGLSTPMAITPFGWVFYDYDSLYLYDDGKWETVWLQADQTNALVGKTVIGFSPDGSIWVMDGNQPRSFDGKEVKSPFEEKPCANYFSDGRITSTGSIWAVSSGYVGYVCYMDTDAQQVFNYESFFAIAGWDIAPDDSIWVSSRAGFIANIGIDTLRRGNYRDIELIKVGGDSLNYTLVPERIEVDSHGAVWVFVKDSGLYRYDGSEWKYFGMSNLPYPYVFSIDNQGTPSVGMCGKLLTHDGEKWIQYSQNCLNPSNMTITSTGAIWFVDSCDGAYRFEEGEWTHFEKDDLGGMLVNRIIEAPDGAIWFFGYGKWIRYQE